MALTALKPEFFVVTEAVGVAAKDTPVTMGVASVLQRQAIASSGDKAPWIIPEPLWGTDDVVTHCNADPQALGGVVLTLYHGFATHFFLLWQSETTTFEVSATVISCKGSGGSAAPTIVGLIDELPGANGTPWVVRRSQVSLPLVTIAGYTTALASKNNKSATLNSAAVLGAVLGGAGSHDIPGYSDPVRLRAAAQHIGDDLNGALSVMCRTHADVPDAAPRGALCGALGYGTGPATTP